jgi:hypothetical protein
VWQKNDRCLDVQAIFVIHWWTHLGKSFLCSYLAFRDIVVESITIAPLQATRFEGTQLYFQLTCPEVGGCCVLFNVSTFQNCIRNIAYDKLNRFDVSLPDSMLS